MVAIEHITSDAISEPAVRPKVLRRPAHFTATSSTKISFVPLLSAEDSDDASPSIQPGKPWQDDGRFALALLTIIIVMNVAVTFWLAHLTHTTPPSLQSTTQQMHTVARAPMVSDSDASNSNATELSSTEVHVLDSLASTAASE